ncbi:MULTISPECIES: hypothetical protein [Ramlibacter]|uniref:Uncharacterized protein n=1 Tax=Ramlibacter pinisoli TaxID=2682844 RepID=A0A6N8J3L3_9BURK|nr:MULTISPECIES: hypothetical protein [Ramlibacter]MBA2962910.1 hypothetical protein [Ramlibacter sp. CGMCC 1.13660]MVQ32853.1 hypothetical protein [Ramlibacter pinisoli]
MKFGPSRDNGFAKDLVERLTKELPPTLIETRRKVLSVNKVTRQLEKTFQAAAAYQRENRLGFIRRAFLANGFRWGLKNAGYPDDFIDVAVEGLVVELSKPTRSAPSDPS